MKWIYKIQIIFYVPEKKKKKKDVDRIEMKNSQQNETIYSY